jgi:hypothetical protein
MMTEAHVPFAAAEFDSFVTAQLALMRKEARRQMASTLRLLRRDRLAAKAEGNEARAATISRMIEVAGSRGSKK